MADFVQLGGRRVPAGDQVQHLRRFIKEVVKYAAQEFTQDQRIHQRGLVLGLDRQLRRCWRQRTAIDLVGEIGLVRTAAIVIGTEDDPQDIESQINQLENAGVKTFRKTAEAVLYIIRTFSAEMPEPGRPVKIEDLHNPLAAINVGLESFYESLLSQGAEAVQVDWRPPAGGDKNLMDILAKMR